MIPVQGVENQTIAVLGLGRSGRATVAALAAGGANVVVRDEGADTREEAELLASSQQQAFVALRTGNPGKMKPPVEGYKDSLPPNARAILDHVLQCSAVGTAADVADGLEAFIARTGVDEVIVASSIYDHAARRHSLTLAMEAMKRL